MDAREKPEGSLYSLIFERTTELAMQLESLWVEAEVLGKQKAPKKGDQKASHLVTESRSFPQVLSGTAQCTLDFKSLKPLGRARTGRRQPYRMTGLQRKSSFQKKGLILSQACCQRSCLGLQSHHRFSQ